MPRETETIKLLKTLLGLYMPRGGEVRRLAEIAKLNKLLLAYLRRVGDALRDELVREEARYRWFTRNAAEVVEVLEDIGAIYALYKFRRPLDHVSVDLDTLVSVEDVPKAVKALVSRGFKVVVWEPYTATLARDGFIVDLYTQPSFAWIVYINGEKLLKYAEDFELNGIWARGISREAEVAVTAAHSIYKEHMVLLIDCLVAQKWMNGRTKEIAAELKVEKALEELLNICESVNRGLVEAPIRLKLPTLLATFLEKAVKDSTFRATLPNATRYLMRRSIGADVLSRLTRKSY
jgi:hypothetical protein